MHRDVNPNNILLRLKGNQAEAVLIDFGLALDFDHSLTTRRAKQVSAGFTPIEMCSKGQKIGPCSDVYGLAATLYQLLTGETPPESYDRKANKVRLVSPKEMNSQISEETSQAIIDGMALEPQNRPQSVGAWLKKFESTKTKASSKGSGSTKKPVNWTKWGVVWAGVAAIAGLLAALPDLVGMLSPTPQPSTTPTSQPTTPPTP